MCVDRRSHREKFSNEPSEQNVRKKNLQKSPLMTAVLFY